jgi:leucine-zipper-like transcriptional regulator 1
MEWNEVIASQGRPPSARHSHSAVVHQNSIYIFGGYDGSYKSDLHEFDILLSKWNAVPVVGRRPRARYRTTCTVHDNWMILYGGHGKFQDTHFNGSRHLQSTKMLILKSIDGTRHLSDTFLFDFDSKTWFSLHTDGIAPAPRDSHVSVVHGNSMFVFGGSSGRAMNDFYELQVN